jgi:hypothetical protein
LYLRPHTNLYFVFMKRACIVLAVYLLKSCQAFHVGLMHCSVQDYRSSFVGNRRARKHAALEVSYLPGGIPNVRRPTVSRAHTPRMYLSTSVVISLAENFPKGFVVDPSEIWNRYEVLLAQYPHTVDAATGIVLYLLGQLVSGLITRQEVPPVRLFRWMLFGSIDGLLTHDWYQAVELLGSHVGGDGWGKPLFMIASDTLVYTPTYCLVFIIVMVPKFPNTTRPSHLRHHSLTPGRTGAAGRSRHRIRHTTGAFPHTSHSSPLVPPLTVSPLRHCRSAPICGSWHRGRSRPGCPSTRPSTP